MNCVSDADICFTTRFDCGKIGIMSNSLSYEYVRTDARFKEIAQEMISFAEQNLLDQHQIEVLLQNQPGTKEQHGPITRIHGKESGALTKWSRFVTFSKELPRPLQISFYLYKANGKRLRQVTISSSAPNAQNKKILNVGDISRIASFFIKNDRPIHSVETPEHIVLMIQEE